MSRIPIRIKFLFFAILALAGIVFLAQKGFEATQKTIETAKLSSIVTLTKDQLRVDMMHDAMHANVLQALAEINNPKELESIKAKAEDNAKTAKEAFKEIEGLDLPEQFKDSFSELEKHYFAYIDNVQKMLKVISEHNPQSQSIYKSDFLPVFQKLADEQEALQEEVNSYSNKMAEKAVEEAKLEEEFIISTAAVSILLALALQIFAQFSLFRPQRKLLKIADCLSGKDAASCDDIPYKNRHDEIGKLAKTLVILRTSIESRLKMAQNFENKVKHSVEIVASAATEMESTADQMSEMAKENEDKISELSIGVNSTTQNIQQTSVAVQQIYASMNEISKQVANASQINNEAAEEVSRVSNVAAGLETAAHKVNDINGIITSIAEKINLLALNATIEAARAGEYGKGFAVVASEVKSLASQTASSASQVDSHIKSIQKAATDTLNGVKGIEVVIEKINNISSTIASAIEEQGIGTQDIAKNMKEASETSGTISFNASFAAKTATSTWVSIEQMQKAASDLSKQAEFLRNEVELFLVSMS